MLRRIANAFCVALLVSPAFAGPPALPDQYGQSGSLDDYRGEPVLAIVVSARKLRHVQRWEERLRAGLPGLQSLRVADVAENPKPDLEEVAAGLRKRAPEGIAVYIDLDNAWAATYDLDTNEPCLLLFDADHNVVARFRGRVNAERLTAVETALRPYFDAPDQATRDAS